MSIGFVKIFVEPGGSYATLFCPVRPFVELFFIGTEALVIPTLLFTTYLYIYNIHM